MNDQIAFLIGIFTLLGLVYGWWRKWARPKYRAAKAEALKVKVTLIGADPVVNPATGETRDQRIPGIAELHAETATAVNKLTGQVETLTRSVQVLVDREMVDLRQRVDGIDGRVKILEDARIERVVGQVAQAETFRAMGDLAGKPPVDLPPAAVEHLQDQEQPPGE